MDKAAVILAEMFLDRYTMLAVKYPAPLGIYAGRKSFDKLGAIAAGSGSNLKNFLRSCCTVTFHVFFPSVTTRAFVTRLVSIVHNFTSGMDRYFGLGAPDDAPPLQEPAVT